MGGRPAFTRPDTTDSLAEASEIHHAVKAKLILRPQFSFGPRQTESAIRQPLKSSLLQTLFTLKRVRFPLVREGGVEPPCHRRWILSPKCSLIISYFYMNHAPSAVVQLLFFPCAQGHILSPPGTFLFPHSPRKNYPVTTHNVKGAESFFYGQPWKWCDRKDAFPFLFSSLSVRVIPHHSQ